MWEGRHMEAYIYARWSSREQRHGNTIPRQRGVCEDFAKQQGWKVALSFHDDGVSAWTGANLETGALAQFIDGLGATGGVNKILVVEQLDRITRLPPMEVLNWIQRACATGLTIATANDQLLITSEKLVKEPFNIMAVVMNAFRAFSESETKSERGIANWEIKRAKGEPMTAQAPKWLKVRKNDGKRHFEVIPERVEIVRRIYRECLSGRGKAAIARTLNEDGIPCFGKAKGWRSSYIFKILKSEAVIGRYQPCTKPKKALRRTPVGDPIEGYFPSIIDEATFAKVQNRPRTTSVAAGRRFANLWSGIARCCECNGPMNLRMRGHATRATGEVVREEYLICDNATRALCSDYLHFNYAKATTTILDRLLHLALDDRYFDNGHDVRQVEVAVAASERTVLNASRRSQKLLSMLTGNDDDDLLQSEYSKSRQRLREVQQTHADLTGQRDDMKRAASPDIHLQRVDEMRRLIDSDDAIERDSARLAVKTALDELVESFHFSASSEKAVLRLRGGTRHIVVTKSGGLVSDTGIWRTQSQTGDSSVLKDYFRRKQSSPLTPEDTSFRNILIGLENRCAD